MNILHQVKWLILITLLVNAAAMFSPVINGGDAITYAAISQHIALHNDWINLVLEGQDWLDKPHLPFWITALFFKIGGVRALTYILPGFLCHLIGAYFTFRIARFFYSRDAAWLALLVYVSAYQLMDTAIEVKAEVYLTGFIMAACYYWLRYDAAAKLKYLLLGACFSAFAVMTKGEFTLITISSGLVCMWWYQGRARNLWSKKWLLAFALTGLFVLPELISLYLQFDRHPEKVVFGQTHISGIRFFLWDSQFGRFFNTGPIQNHNGYPLYFLLVFLWAFLPWVAVFMVAVYSGIRGFSLLAAHERAGFIFLCGGFFVTFVLFSGTSFQIDHYMVILFPFSAILCGKFLDSQLASHRVTRSSNGRLLFTAQSGITALLLVLACILGVYLANVILIGVLAMSCMLAAYVCRGKSLRYVRGMLIYPVLGINILYLFIVFATALAFTSYGIAHNAEVQLANKAVAPVYVYRMDMVGRELGLYHPAPCYDIFTAAQLPQRAHYYLLARSADLAQLEQVLQTPRQLAQGWWVVHKTGTFPRLLRLATGREDREDIRILEIGARE